MFVQDRRMSARVEQSIAKDDCSPARDKWSFARDNRSFTRAEWMFAREEQSFVRDKRSSAQAERSIAQLERTFVNAPPCVEEKKPSCLKAYGRLRQCAMSANGGLTVTAVISATGHEVRWRILELLLGEALNVSELARRMGLPARLVSRHVGILRECGVINRGLGALYRIRKDYLGADGRTVDLGRAVLRFPGSGTE